MRDVVMVRVRGGVDIDAVLRRTEAILDRLRDGSADGQREVWVHRRGRLAMFQSPRSPASACEQIAMYRARHEAFAYSGFVSDARHDAAAVRELLSVTWSGKLLLERSPGGNAAFFFASARRGRAWAWSSHAGVEGVFHTRGADCIAISSSPLASHLVGLQREEPSFSREWARRVLLSGATLWDDTPYEQTLHAPPRSLTILRGDAVEFAPHPVPLEQQRYADRDPAGIAALNAAALEAVSVLRRWPRAEVQLSGGKDSRYVAALLRRAGIEANHVTHSPPTSGEGAAAAAVARALGIDHRIVPGPTIATGDQLVPTILANLRRSDGLLGESRHLAYRPLQHAGEPLVQGQAHHPRGGYTVTSPSNDRRKMTARLVRRTIGDQQLVAPELVDERRRRLEEILAGYEVDAVADIYYWLYNDWRMTRWTIGAYRSTSLSRPVVWPMMDERVLAVLSELSSTDRMTEVAFYAALCQLGPELAGVPLHVKTWRFDATPVGQAEFPTGLPTRMEPFAERGGGGRTAERRVSTIQPLFRMAVRDARFSDELRRHIPADTLRVLEQHPEPSEALGCPHNQIIGFMWKVVAVALVTQGEWLGAQLGPIDQAGPARG